MFATAVPGRFRQIALYRSLQNSDRLSWALHVVNASLDYTLKNCFSITSGFLETYTWNLLLKMFSYLFSKYRVNLGLKRNVAYTEMKKTIKRLLTRDFFLSQVEHRNSTDGFDEVDASAISVRTDVNWISVFVSCPSELCQDIYRQDIVFCQNFQVFQLSSNVAAN